MVATWVVVAVSVAYLALLFAIAFYGDRRADAGRSIISNGYIYALSIAVYATSWTYYGSVGTASTSGVAWLPIYLGPTVVVVLWWVVLRKIIRICKRDRITSLADFVSARYGKSQVLGGLVTVVAVLGLVPYIALQLKAISTTFSILRGGTGPLGTGVTASVPVVQDTALYAALLLAAFTIVFGTRHLDATERHEGMVAAIAFESLVKLVAFLVVGSWVTFGLFDGFADVVGQAAERADLAELLTLESTTGYASFFWLTVLSMLAFLLLPRQWQVAVVENVDENHVRTATWVFPLYLLLINVFVLPISLAGLLRLPEADADTFVLALPMADGRPLLALLVFVGGLSAATGMVIVETIALSTMVSNSLVMPLLLRNREALRGRTDLGAVVLLVRRVTIVVLLLLGFAYFRMAADALGLVQIGLVSFAAVAQFAPAVLLGLYWKGATRAGAVTGLVAGVATWAYTLLLPSFSESGWLPASIPGEGPFGVRLLAPYSLFGLDGLDPVSHAMLWSLLANVGLLVAVSLAGRRDPVEHLQAAVFVDAMRRPSPERGAALWRGSATVGALSGLLERFVGPHRAGQALQEYARSTGADVRAGAAADAGLIHHVEALLSGSVGTASARVLVSSVVAEEPLGLDEVLDILDEASQVRAYSRELERKSAELERATADLRAANERLTELDRLKDDFMSTVTHELRTPLTSIRAFSEILLDNPDLTVAERQAFLGPIVEETERLTRLINQVLDLAKLESGAGEWHVEPIDLRDAVEASTHATAQLFASRGVTLRTDLPDVVPPVRADRDRVVQVMVNLLGNAVKFADPQDGQVTVAVRPESDVVRVDVHDNGPGVPPADRDVIFDKFRQGGDVRRNRPAGTGLGLPISREIVDHLGGRLWVDDGAAGGATFSFTLPLAGTED
ncbi:MAG: sodium:solute symporter family transporter [Actinomycetes bacterium]